MFWQAWFWLILDVVLVAACFWQIRRLFAMPQEWTDLFSNRYKPTEGIDVEDQEDG